MPMPRVNDAGQADAGADAAGEDARQTDTDREVRFVHVMVVVGSQVGRLAHAQKKRSIMHPPITTPIQLFGRMAMIRKARPRGHEEDAGRRRGAIATIHHRVALCDDIAAVGPKVFPGAEKYFPGMFFARTTTRVHVHLSGTCAFCRVFVSVAFLPGKCFLRSFGRGNKWFVAPESRVSRTHASSILVERVPIGQLFFHFPGRSGGSHATDFISQVWTCHHVHVDLARSTT